MKNKILKNKTLKNPSLPLSSMILFFMILSFSSVRADEKSVRAAIEVGLKRIDQGAANYVKNTSCYSCHHQAHAVPILVGAKARGFAVNEKRLPEQLAFTLESFRPFKEQILKGRGIPGGNTMAAYALLTLEQGGHRRDDVTDMLIEYLLVRQKPDGSWPALMKRPPSEGSDFTNMANILRAFRQWTSDDNEQRKRIDEAFEKGKRWLLANKPEDTEDRAFLLRALIVVSAGKKRIDEARDKLLESQNDDGSWSQLPNLKGDAYATGLVLMSLRQAGVSVDDAAYRKGVQFLVKTQHSDGSWLVTTRSRPVQKFFDNGDPHGKSQFISFAATGWAVQALLETIPPR
jgi:N-acyl-D-amino-acid deacylase